MTDASSSSKPAAQDVPVRGNFIKPVPPPVSEISVVQGGCQIEVPKPTIIIDTREQEGHFYSFDRFPNWIAGTRRAALKVGDYTLDGREDEITVERKTLEDLVSTLTVNRKTFIRACQRMERLKRKIIVIESTMACLKSPYMYSDAHPNSIFGTLVAIQERFGIFPVFAATRELAEEYTASTLVKYHTLRWLEEHGYEHCFVEGDI